MKRDEIIDFLIEDKINEWVHARCYEGLEIILYDGWMGFGDYTDEELREAFGDLDEDNFDKAKAKKIRLIKRKLKI